MFAFRSRRPSVRRPTTRLHVDILQVGLVPSGLVPVSADANDWPMYNHNPAGTRHNAAESQLNPRTVGRLEVKWRFPTEGPIAGTPAVVGNTVYAVDGLGWVYAVRRNGRELWRTHVAVDNFVSGKVSASLLVT